MKGRDIEKQIVWLILILFAGVILLSACKEKKMETASSGLQSIQDIPEQKWEILSEKKIFFGHQSVGYNIVDGIKDVMKVYPHIKLNIVETNNADDFNGPLFAHSKVGQNVKPETKINEFSKLIDAGIGESVDIAFLKFCYVDINSQTDVKKLFALYKKSHLFLAEKYPETLFLHVTIPLTIVQGGAKAWIKKLIGKPITGYDENIKRNNYNHLLKKEFSGREPVFDLAQFESTTLSGGRTIFKTNGKTYYSLTPEFTNDGGHLNESGRKFVAEQLLIFLANL